MSQNDDIVNILEDMAVLMELADENSFKIKAIQNGARALDALEMDVHKALEEGSLVSVRGIGKGILELLREYHDTGTIQEFERLKAAVPEGVFSLTRLRGVGAKKAKLLHEKLGVSSIGELEYACLENRLLELKGFGEKSQAAILNSIQLWQAAQGKCLIHVATRLAEEIAAECTAIGATEVAVAGQVRRHCEVVDEVVLVACDLPAKKATEHFQASVSENHLRFVRDGVPVRIVISKLDNHARTLFTESASAEFLDAFEEQYAITSATTEEQIFSAHKLQWIEPELRENATILELAKTQSIPRLVENDDMQGMLHIHTTWSDGAHSLREMALASKALGFRYVAMCDHSKTAVYANGLSVDRVHHQHHEIDALNEEDLGISILKGIESDILPDGSLDYDDEILESFDIVVASVHSAFNLSIEVQTERIIRAIRNPYTTIVGHPTGRLLLARPGYELHMERILQAAAETGTVIELNANPRRLDLDWRWHRRAAELGVSLAINPDSHQTSALSEVFIGVRMARKGMLRKQDVVNTMSEREFRQFASELREAKMGGF